MYGDRLGNKERDLGMRFMAAYHKANAHLRQRLVQPGGRDEIGAIFQKFLPIENVALYQKMGIGLGNENLSVNVDGTYGLAWQMQQYRDRGLILAAPDLAKVVDNSFAEAAAKRK